MVDHPESDARRSRAARRQAPSQLGVAEPGPQRRAERGRVVGGTSSPGRTPSAPWPRASAHPADLGRDDRQATGERLGDHHAVRLGARRAARAGRQRRSCDRDPLRCAAPRSARGRRARRPRARRRRLSANAGSRSRLPTHRQCQDSPVIVASASSSTSWPLPGITAATQSSAPAGRRPRCERGGIDAGLGDVHAVARQRVQLQQRSSAPRARRDDGSGGREDRALPRRGRRRRPCPGPAACARARPAAAGSPAAPAPPGPSTRRVRRAARGRRRGSRWTTPARAAYAAASGRGQEPGTAWTCTGQPLAASPRQTRRS